MIQVIQRTQRKNVMLHTAVTMISPRIYVHVNQVQYEGKKAPDPLNPEWKIQKHSSHEGQTPDYECTGHDSEQARQRLRKSQGAVHLSTFARTRKGVGQSLLTVRGSQNGGVNGDGGSMDICICGGWECHRWALVGLEQCIIGEEYKGETGSRYFDLTHVVGLVTGNSLYVECANKPPIWWEWTAEGLGNN